MFGLLLALASADPCPTSLTERVVRGNSMAGIVDDGSVVTVQTPATCAPIARGDLVLWTPGGHDTPVLKAVRAVATDRVALVEGIDGVGISVNGEPQLTPDRGPYTLSPSQTQMLTVYLNASGGTVPDGAVMLLGTDPNGALDSTRVGFVALSDLTGRVVAIFVRGPS